MHIKRLRSLYTATSSQCVFRLQYTAERQRSSQANYLVLNNFLNPFLVYAQNVGFVYSKKACAFKGRMSGLTLAKPISGVNEIMANRGSKIAAITAAALMVTAGAAVVATRGITNGEEMQRQGKLALAKKVLQISSSGTMKEARYDESKTGKGQQVDRNSGNPFPSNTAYHSTTRTTCMEWLDADKKECRPGRELDPYVTPHGMDGGEDASGLESLIVKAYKDSQGKNSDTGGEYKIWDIQTRDGESFIDPLTKGFDSEKINHWSINEDLQKQIAEVGYKTALEETKQVKDLGKGFEVAAAPEILRTMASRYTKILRNRLATNLGENRASQKGTEILLNEEVYDNAQYAKQAKQVPGGDPLDIRLDNQLQLDFRTQTTSLEQRLENAQALKEADVRMPNAQAENGVVTPGNPNTEGFDAAANRLNIALIDRVGIDPNELIKPNDVNFTKKELAPIVGEYDENGNRKLVNVTNADQLESYNEQLREAARGMADSAAKFPGSTPYTNEAIEQTLSFQIAPGTLNAVMINGRTKAMDADLQDTGVPRTSTPDSQSIERNLEVQPSQLTFSAAQ